MDRKKYWNEKYLGYWKNKVDEANCDKGIYVNKNDVKTTSNDLISNFCDLIDLNIQDKVLDFGCGFCRTYPYFKNKNMDYYGIDISEAMINEARNNYSDIEEKLFVAEGEKLPFDDNTFDFELCFGVFDACYQAEALEEMVRTTKLNGVIMITGKNKNYYENDKKAIVAERNARLKGHPNYFTDVKAMIQQLEDNGCTVSKGFFFKRRGDFQNLEYETVLSGEFYEYLLIIEKKKLLSQYKFKEFSYEYSDTYKSLQQCESRR